MDKPEEKSITTRRTVGRMSLPVFGAALWLLTASEPSSAITVDEGCGPPNLDPAVDAGLFLWEGDCGGAARSFSVRALSGGSTTAVTYAGQIDSDLGFDTLTPLSPKNSEQFDLLNDGQRLQYEMRVISIYWGGFDFNFDDESATSITGVSLVDTDGFDFSFASAANVCFGVDLPAGTEVLVGPNAIPVAAPFDLTTYQSCTAPFTGICGVPSYDPAIDAGLYVWDEACGSPIRSFSVRALAGGSAAAVTYAGRIDADQSLSAFAPDSLKRNDSVEVLDRGLSLQYDFRVASLAQAGFAFNAPNGANICFGLNLPMGTEVHVGKDATLVATPFDLTTLEPCSAPPLVDTCGAPAYDPSLESGLFLWRDCTAAQPSWELATASGASTTHTSGTVTSDSPLDSIEPVRLEPNDILDTTAADSLDFSLNTSSGGVDGFRIVFAIGSTNCIDIPGANPADLKLGPKKLGASVLPLNLETLGPCVTPPAEAMSILVVLTDDQRWDSTWAMPELEAKLNSRGVVFDNAFISTPLCGPSRASIISGGFYPQNTGVLKVRGEMGGESYFRSQDFDTIATALKHLGYKTLFAGGKYINDYEPPYIPPGWDLFLNNDKGPHASDWFNYDVTVGSAGATPSLGQTVAVDNAYVTNFHRDKVLTFLDGLRPEQPFFAFFSVFAPHGPAIPDTQDDALFSDYVYRGRGFGEPDLSDKPLWVSDPDRATSVKTTGYPDDDEFHRNQLRSLASVDRAVGAFIDRLEQDGRLDNTVIIFTSDNGFLWGEHGLHSKGMAYEESIRVPFTIYMPGISPRRDSSLISANLDLGATILDIAGVPASSDGLSLVPLLEDPAVAWRKSLVFQHWGPSEAAYGTWSAIRTERWKYIENAIGEIELYDLVNDEYEMESQHANSSFSGIMADLATQLSDSRLLGVIALRAPNGRVGTPYSFEVTAWGGRPPYSWSVIGGSLPAGLSLNENTGMVSGIPTEVSTSEVQILVQDSSVRPRVGGPQSCPAPLTEVGMYSITIK